MKKITFASDHAGFALKQVLIEAAINLGYDVTDLGTASAIEAVDYPDYGFKAVNAVLSGDAALAIILCGTGIGMSILANRFAGIRAAVCHSEFEAEVARKHNNANILCLGGRVLEEETAIQCLKIFLSAEFEGGRHQRRLDKIDQFSSHLSPCHK